MGYIPSKLVAVAILGSVSDIALATWLASECALLLLVRIAIKNWRLYTSAGDSSAISLICHVVLYVLVLAAPMPKVPERQASSTTTVVNKSLEKLLINALRLQIGVAECGGGCLRTSFRAEDPSLVGTVDADAWFQTI